MLCVLREQPFVTREEKYLPMHSKTGKVPAGRTYSWNRPDRRLSMEKKQEIKYQFIFESTPAQVRSVLKTIIAKQKQS